MYIKSYDNKGQKKYKARFRGLEYEGMGSGFFFFFFEKEQGYTFLNEHHFKRCLNKSRLLGKRIFLQRKHMCQDLQRGAF